MRGAGGTKGGILEFFLGLGMFCAGMYLFMSNISVSNHFAMSSVLFRVGGSSGVGVASGMLFIPFIIGVILIFNNKKSYIGWGLIVFSIGAMIIGMVTSLEFRFIPMSLFNVIMLLVLIFGGVGIFARSLGERRW